KVTRKEKENKRTGLRGDINSKCRICDDDMIPGKSSSLSCGHNFCNDCLRMRLESQLKMGPSCITATCPEQECNVIFPYSVAKRILHPQLFEKYRNYVTQSFVKMKKELCWCPGVNCVWISKRVGISTDVNCRCGSKYCFLCGRPCHSPCTCSLVERWELRLNEDNAARDWLIANSKPCPKCKAHIQKNQGCNHMTCSQCKHEFCWICLGNWSDHGSQTGGFYNCNRPQKSQGANDLDKAKERLEYFTHYHDRYQEHNKSMKFAENQMAEIQSKIRQFMQLRHCEERFAEFVKEGVILLIDCRRVLKWTYVLGYYMEKGERKKLFEFLQQDLEKNTERLSEHTEKKVDAINRDEMLNYIALTRNYLRNLIDGMSEVQGKIRAAD
ncbi:MAG: putative E3 ubiquitin-protein ligase ariadne-1, partial [Streblomastix strix]